MNNISELRKKLIKLSEKKSNFVKKIYNYEDKIKNLNKKNLINFIFKLINKNINLKLQEKIDKMKKEIEIANSMLKELGKEMKTKKVNVYVIIGSILSNKYVFIEKKRKEENTILINKSMIGEMYFDRKINFTIEELDIINKAIIDLSYRTISNGFNIIIDGELLTENERESVIPFLELNFREKINLEYIDCQGYTIDVSKIKEKYRLSDQVLKIMDDEQRIKKERIDNKNIYNVTIL